MTADERNVELYVYDLSRGLARQMSMQFLGIQVDAVYHTSIVVGGQEYYYGHGIQVALPGATHHGAPLEIIALGRTSLPDEVLEEYLESMKAEYTPESYDLFLHNCNNFTADVSMFLCGVGIPEKIKNLPRDVLATPFGQMLRPALEAQLRPITTARSDAPPPHAESANIKVLTSKNVFEKTVESAPCAVAFFTSATCPPCRMVYPHFEQLASEIGERATFIKVDVGIGREIGSIYNISATPTFITWSRGEKLDEWQGASPDDLKQNVDMLLRITYPPHPHTSLSIPTTLDLAFKASRSPAIFSKVPPLDKVLAKLGPLAQDPAVKPQVSFLRQHASGPANAPIPDESRWASFLRASFSSQPPEVLFPLTDLFRASLSDPRVSGWYAEERNQATIDALLTYVASHSETPYNLRLVTVQAVCNLFTSPLFPERLLSPPLSPLLIDLITSSLLDKSHTHLRVAASSLAFQVATWIQKQRSTKEREALEDEKMVELAASFVEAIKEEEESEDVVKALVLSLALMYYCSPVGSEIGEILRAVEAEVVVRGKGKEGKVKVDKKLCEEVAMLVRS